MSLGFVSFKVKLIPILQIKLLYNMKLLRLPLPYFIKYGHAKACVFIDLS